MQCNMVTHISNEQYHEIAMTHQFPHGEYGIMCPATILSATAKDNDSVEINVTYTLPTINGETKCKS